MTAPSQQKPIVLSIQYLRAFAALLVVLHHARNPADWLFNPLAEFDFGTGGVDIFFIVSGFIMFTAARDENALEFCKRRIIRVVPIYWIATLVLVAGSLVVRANMPQSVGQIIKSLLFIPHYHPDHYPMIAPFLVPGWTLNYEMLFYLIFAIGLLTRHVIVTTSVIILGLVAGIFLDDGSLYAEFYSSPMMLEFLAGIFVGWANLRFDLSRCWILLPIGLVALVGSNFLELFGRANHGAPALLIVIGALGLERRGSVGTLPLFKLLGDASYSIYLFHTIYLAVWKRLFAEIPVSGWIQFLSYVSLGMIGCCLTGVAAYLFIEKPIIRGLSSRFLAPRTTQREPVGSSLGGL